MGNRELPMSPDEYVKTLPKVTVAAAVLLTVGEDRPVMLRSVFKRGGWQFPGGNSEYGEDPRTAAAREAEEETGLQVPGPMDLLLMHFIHPGATGWPLPKIVCVFDGGNITWEQFNSIRLDPEEHDHVRALQWDDWATEADASRMKLLNAVHRARLTGRAEYVVRGTP
ncbi:NUDIX domain-containing protein [Streptomyces roseifaciens]|uniref:NUDIX domain-containing protein n=1 Tax=Streptomyces roseifaciens TaxID=1488406 RepID=UPI0007C84B2F|nr:NUDIX domain-containing protein [Streptomyces roseifaciens]